MLFKEPGAAKHARHVANLLSMYALFSGQIGSLITRLAAAKQFCKEDLRLSFSREARTFHGRLSLGLNIFFRKHSPADHASSDG